MFMLTSSLGILISSGTILWGAMSAGSVEKYIEANSASEKDICMTDH